MSDYITILPSTADWLSTLGLGDFNRLEMPERMAWVVRILRELPDEDTFPHGKWGTIQSIEAQLDDQAKHAARALPAADAGSEEGK